MAQVSMRLDVDEWEGWNETQTAVLGNGTVDIQEEDNSLKVPALRVSGTGAQVLSFIWSEAESDSKRLVVARNRKFLFQTIQNSTNNYNPASDVLLFWHVSKMQRQKNRPKAQ